MKFHIFFSEVIKRKHLYELPFLNTDTFLIGRRNQLERTIQRSSVKVIKPRSNNLSYNGDNIKPFL